MSRRKKYYYSDNPDDLVRGALILIILSIIGIYLKYKNFINENKIFIFATILMILILAVFILFLLYKKRRRKETEYDNDDKIIYMFKGMPPAEFEREMADMFFRLGYKTKVTGGPHDGGVDVVAEKDGEKYFIQCKKHITSEAGVHDIRDFYGAVSAGMAKKGFFITANKFTLDAEEFAKENSRIELIDAPKLAKYYKMSLKHKKETNYDNFNKNTAESETDSNKCPLCGGNLILRTAKKGSYAGKNFYGCSNYPNCKFIKK